MQAYLGPLRVLNFRRLWMANLVGHLTLFMHTMASLWMGFELTESAVFLGFVGLCQSLPMAVVPVIGGAIADKWDRRRVLMLCQCGFLLNAACMALLVATDVVRPWYILVHVGLFGTLMSINLPTRQALMANTVPGSVLRQTVTIHFATQSATRILGPGLAGYVINLAGADACYAIQSGLYLVAIAFISGIDVRSSEREVDKGKTRSHLTEGLVYLVAHRVILSIIGLTSLAALVGMGYMDMLPIFSAEILGGGPTKLGMMMTAGGCGALVGMSVLMVSGKTSRRGLTLLLMTAVLGLSLIGLASSSTLFPTLIVLGFAGLANTAIRATNNSLLLELIPDTLRGRVMGISSVANNGLKAIGSLSIGVIAGSVGAPAAVGLCGAILLVGAVVLGSRFPSIIKLR